MLWWNQNNCWKITFDQYLRKQSMASNDCPVCHDGFTDPRSLPCGHTFCQGCIHKWTKGTKLNCPIDRKLFDIPPGGFSKNYALQMIIQPQQQQQQRPRVPQRPTGISPMAPLLEPTSTQTSTLSQMHSTILRNVKHVLRIMADDCNHKLRTKILVASLLLITFSRCIAGAVKLSSDCSMEKDVAVYLFVKSWFGFFKWPFILGLVIKGEIGRALKNLFYQIFLVTTTLFSFIWLIIGSVRVFGKHQEMKEVCPLETGLNSWTEYFINFAIFVTALDWIIVGIFLFFFLYILCDDGRDADDDYW